MCSSRSGKLQLGRLKSWRGVCQKNVFRIYSGRLGYYWPFSPLWLRNTATASELLVANIKVERRKERRDSQQDPLAERNKTGVAKSQERRDFSVTQTFLLYFSQAGGNFLRLETKSQRSTDLMKPSCRVRLAHGLTD